MDGYFMLDLLKVKNTYYEGLYKKKKLRSLLACSAYVHTITHLARDPTTIPVTILRLGDHSSQDAAGTYRRRQSSGIRTPNLRSKLRRPRGAVASLPVAGAAGYNTCTRHRLHM